MHIHRSFTIILFVLTAALSATANDTLATLGAGGLVPVKSAEIVMESEDLQISIHQITVKYVFRNNSDRDVDAAVTFPLPELDGGMVEHMPLDMPSQDPVNFLDFKVLAAGKHVSTKTETRAFIHGRDITVRLQTLGLPISVIDAQFQPAIKKLPHGERDKLEKEELIASDEISTSVDRPSEVRYWPNWRTRIQFYWIQHFPARSSIEIEHNYRPIAGGSYIAEIDTGESTIKPYCGGEGALNKISALKQKHNVRVDAEPVLLERRIQYILTTANNWSGPIRNFRLSVISDSSEDVVLTCLSGLKRVAPTRYELVRSNYRPSRDLELLILQARK